MATLERSVTPQRKPLPGDQLHVIGHGPAVLLEAVLSGSDIAAYKVRYPDGTQDSVAPDQALICEKKDRSASRMSQGSGCDSQGLGQDRSERNDRAEPLMQRGVSGSSQPPLSASPRGPRQLEYLGRAFDDERRSIATPSATFSLVATMVGGGVLSLPFAMSQCGLVLGTGCLMLSAVGSAWTLSMLVDCARATGRDSFELVGHAAYGEFSRKGTIALVFIICWLTKIAYFVLLTDLMVPVAELCVPALQSLTPAAVRRVVVCVAAVLLSPMCFKSSLSSLRFMCFASVGSVIVVGCVVGLRAIENFGIGHQIQVQMPNHTNRVVEVSPSYNLWPADWAKALYVFPTFGVSFLCHFNALPTHQELARPTRSRMRRVILVTLTLTSLIYLFVSVCGYLFAGCYTCGNVLLNFSSDDSLITVARAALSLVLMLNFPLICQPCRNALFRLLNGAGCLKAAEPPHQESQQDSSGSFSMEIVATSDPQLALSPESREPSREPPREPREPREPAVGLTRSRTPPASPPQAQAQVHVYLRQDTRGGRGQPSGPDTNAVQVFDTFLPKEEAMQQGALEPTKLQRIVMTTLLLGTSLLVSCVMRSIMVVWAVIGSTVSFLIAFILPAMFWYKVVGPTARPWRRHMALALVAFCTVCLGPAATA
ncbi:unnamed protein product [Effrenium voratum]|uniref:Amino acid transporter transmembrane domain-containing protein n=1 Tax=Effrenium voratum TaxID=2562239 RepID=A0AA36IPW2_9DINO|nr:unnamed protein product [Effrenium voratum]